MTTASELRRGIPILLLFSSSALADTTIGAAAESVYQQPALLIIAIGLLVGFGSVIAGLMHLRKTGISPQQYPMGEGLLKLGSGVLALSFTFVYTVVKNSFFTAGDDSWNTTPGSLSISNSITESNTMLENSFVDTMMNSELKVMVFGLLWLIGLVFIFVGINKIKTIMNKGGEGGVKNPVIQILGGVACMNPMLTLCILAQFGPTFLCAE